MEIAEASLIFHSEVCLYPFWHNFYITERRTSPLVEVRTYHKMTFITDDSQDLHWIIYYIYTRQENVGKIFNKSRKCWVSYPKYNKSTPKSSQIWGSVPDMRPEGIYMTMTNFGLRAVTVLSRPLGRDISRVLEASWGCSARENSPTAKFKPNFRFSFEWWYFQLSKVLRKRVSVFRLTTT